jgi:predicted ATPase
MKKFESFGLDTPNQCLWRDDVQIALPPKPFAVLRYLVENPGRLITHDELLDALWPETYVQPQVLRTYMLELRKALGDDPRQPRFIQTLPKRGYRFVASVVEGAQKEPHTTQAEAEHEAKAAAIVDRKQELELLHARARLVERGQRQVVFVTGETGIGKTALVEAFSRQMGSLHPTIIARGQCVQGIARKEEYFPVMELLGQICASPDGEVACRILARKAPAWLAALGREPAIAEIGDTRAPAQDRRMADLCAALDELAAEKALILIFEDLHWADDSTVDLISALARRRTPASLMLLATYRPHEAAVECPLKGLKHDLLMRRLAVEVALEPLARKVFHELLSRELGQDMLPKGLAEFVHRHSEGNPLFAIAIVEHLIAQQILVRDSANGAPRWEASAPIHELEAAVPEELAQMIELEIERLPAKEQSLLEAGSLMSVAFPAWGVAAALNEEMAATEDACDELARRLYFVSCAGQDELPDGTRSAFYVFAHELYREVLYRRQGETRRAKRHVRIAERLGVLFAGREATVSREMAMHLEAAGEWRRAASALRVAAAHAGQRRAYAEAEALLLHAQRIAENLSGSDREAIAVQIRGDLAGLREAGMEIHATPQKV